MSGSKDDYETLVSYYLSTSSLLQGLKDVSLVGMLVAALLILVQGYPVTVYLLPLAAHLFLHGVEKACGIEVNSRFDPTKNGWSPDIVERDATEEHLDDDASTQCVKSAQGHAERGELIRTYRVFYVVGYEVYRSLQTENFYCENHMDCADETVNEATEDAVAQTETVTVS